MPVLETMARQKLSTKKIGRPRQFDEELALDAAMRVFADKGFETASLVDLTEAMGINRFSMYATFGNKEALFRKALERYAQMLAAEMESCLAAVPAREGVLRLLRNSALRVTDPQGPGACLVTQAPLITSDLSSETHQLVAQKRAGIELALDRRFARAIQDGELPRGAVPADLARYYAVMMQGLALQAQHGATRDQLFAVIDVAMGAWPAAERPPGRRPRR